MKKLGKTWEIQLVVPAWSVFRVQICQATRGLWVILVANDKIFFKPFNLTLYVVPTYPDIGLVVLLIFQTFFFWKYFLIQNMRLLLWTFHKQTYGNPDKASFLGPWLKELSWRTLDKLESDRLVLGELKCWWRRATQKSILQPKLLCLQSIPEKHRFPGTLGSGLKLRGQRKSWEENIEGSRTGRFETANASASQLSCTWCVLLLSGETMHHWF